MSFPAWFWAWAAWRDAGTPAGKRPPSAPARIPAWAWTRYALHRGGLKPKPKPTVLEPVCSRIFFAAEDPLDAIGLEAGWMVALTADPNPSYSKWATKATAKALRDNGLLVGAWGNQSQIGAVRIRALHAALGADGEPIFQAETQAELEAALVAGAVVVIGNPNAWDDAERQPGRLRNAETARQLAEDEALFVIAECYTNVSGPWPDTYSSRGVPLSSFCLGFGEFDGGTYRTAEEYQAHTKAADWPRICGYHVAGYRGDWRAFP